MKKEIRITGFGGQGVILAGYILGKAASIYDKKASTMVQSYGPEARGSACAAQVIISDDTIHDPYVRSQEILAALSQEGYDIFAKESIKGGTLLYDSDLVDPPTDTKNAGLVASVPSTRTAEKLGRRMAANIVMLGFLTGCTEVVSPDAMREAVRSSVPKGTEEFNLDALEQGMNFAKAALEKEKSVS